MAKAAAKKAQKIPLAIRLKAWWEGYDANELAALQKPEILEKKSEPKVESRKHNPALDAPTPLQGEDPSSLAQMEEELVDHWDPSRIDVAQLIWGRGYCGPGGPEYVIAISKLLALSPEMSMMHLGAGLGGPARALAEEFGVWVTGFETSEALVKTGMELSTQAGLAKKAALSYLNLNADKPFDRRYDRVFADSFISLATDKLGVLKKVESCLKPEGMVLLTDYFVSSESATQKEQYQEWIAHEPRRILPATHDSFVAQLNQADYLVRVDDDLTHEYVGLIDKAWAGADRVVLALFNEPGQAHLANVLLKEAELWNKRARLLRSGLLSYRRILLAKNEKKVIR